MVQQLNMGCAEQCSLQWIESGLLKEEPERRAVSPEDRGRKNSLPNHDKDKALQLTLKTQAFYSVWHQLPCPSTSAWHFYRKHPCVVNMSRFLARSFPPAQSWLSHRCCWANPHDICCWPTPLHSFTRQVNAASTHQVVQQELQMCTNSTMEQLGVNRTTEALHSSLFLTKLNVFQKQLFFLPHKNKLVPQKLTGCLLFHKTFWNLHFATLLFYV